MVEMPSVCPFDCPDACGLLVAVRDGVAVKVRGNPEHPYSRGTLCPKMTGYDRSVHSPERLLYPLIRTGKKGEGVFRRASWDEATTIIADRLRLEIDRHGGEAILPYSYAGSMGLVQRNAGYPFFHTIGATRLERSICTPAQGAAWQTVMGTTPGPSPDEVLESDLVVLWGIDAVATNLHFVHRVKEAKRRGARVLVIETHRNETSKLADLVLLVRPGSDGALALALIHVLAREGLCDREFIEKETSGFRELEAHVRERCAPSWAAEIVGIEEETIVELARTLARSRAPFIRMGGGPSRHGNGAMNVRSVVVLSAVLGAFGRRGGGCFLSTSSSLAFDMAPLLREDLLERPTRTFTMNGLGHDLKETRDPPVTAMYVWCANPVAVAPDQNAIIEGLSREDLFLAVHERFLTDTARFADVVLPATTSLEHADVYRSYGQYVVQRVKPVVTPVGEARSNWDVFRLLAKKMRIEDPVFLLSTDDLINLVLDASARNRPAFWQGVDRGALDRGCAVTLNVPRGAGWGTKSGKIELWSPVHEHPLPCYLPSHSAREKDPLPLQLVTAPALYTLNSTFQEREELRRKNGGVVLRLSPVEARRRGLADGDRVVLHNALGEAFFLLRVDEGVPPGIAVARGVPWLVHTEGGRNVNALTSQRLTDDAHGSTFYDNRVEVRRAPATAFV